MKRVSVIAIDTVPEVFNDTCIKELARVGNLPEDMIARFARSVRGSIQDYVLAVHEPSANEIHREIKALYRAADRQEYDEVASLLKGLSAPARDWLEGGRLPAWLRRDMGFIKLPTAGALGKPAHRKQACDVVRQMCIAGRTRTAGRRRSKSKRSRDTYQPVLRAPKPTPHFPKREPELDLVMSLQLSFYGATGRMPALTAHANSPGPFARMVRKVLSLAGANHADAVDLINKLNRRRRELERSSTAAWLSTPLTPQGRFG